MYQVQASLTALSFSPALSVVTKPVFLNDILMLEDKLKKNHKKTNIRAA